MTIVFDEAKQYRVTVKADENDGDYRTRVSKMGGKAMNAVMPIIKLVKEYPGQDGYANSHNFEYGECTNWRAPYWILDELDLDEGDSHGPLEDFINMIDTGEYGVHTVVSIEVCEWVESVELM